jgi:hypothetical protein
VGHFLGLYHTFQGGCHALWDTAAGDAVYDTPPQADACYGTCPELAAAATDSCRGAGQSDVSMPPYFGKDGYDNFMVGYVVQGAGCRAQGSGVRV